MNQKNDDPVPIGEIAHIEGLNPDSPRYNPNMTNKERNSYVNLIILCPTCHTKIDKDPNYYTVEKLKQIPKSAIDFFEKGISKLSEKKHDID